MFPKKTLKDIDVKDKTVLLRADYNEPIKDGQLADDYRLKKSLVTLQTLMQQRAKIVIVSHLGRPDGEVKPEFSLRPAAERLSELIDKEVIFVDDCIGKDVKKQIENLDDEGIIMLENLRFHPEEEDNDEEFAKTLASYADVMVQDAFAAVHRKHASLVAITKFIPAVSGILLENEIRNINKAMRHPEEPLVAVVGGVKIKTKIAVLDQLMEKAQRLIIGGAMSNTFLAAKGLEIGKSLYDDEELDVARRVMQQAQDNQTELILPLHDVAVADRVDESAERREVATDEIGENDIILDFGEKSISSLIENLKDAKTVIWNGPIGMSEFPNFAKGTQELANAIVKSGAYSVVGGGDTAEFVVESKMMDVFSHVSTGGGAALTLMAGEPLPGVDALLDK